MNKIATIAGLAVAASAMTASADTLLLVDLTVANQVTISATGGLSAADASGSDFTGYLMANFYGAAAGGTALNTLVSGDLTTANNDSDGTPSMFRATGSVGLNIWSFSNDDPVTFTAGALAFTGSATWDLDAAGYAEMLAGNSGGDIYHGADDDSDVGVFVGTWALVPAPSSMALLGLGGIVAGRRRR